MTAALLAAVLFVSPASFQEKEVDRKEVIKSTFKVSGAFVAFEMGDYVHAVVRDKKGEERSFFIGEGGLDFFLAAHSKKPMFFTVQVVNAYIDEAGGRMDIERMMVAKVGKLDSNSWWRAEKRRLSLDKLNEKYQPWVDKLTRVPKL